ncbi:hypothetical protein ACLESD_35430 [Pyxidicoccus sp. 3LFB2]
MIPMAVSKETEDALQKEYQEARAELTADLQLFALLSNAKPIESIEIASTSFLTGRRVIRSRGRYENALNALHQHGL